MSIVLLDKTKCILAGAEGGELILCTHAQVREVYRRMIRGAYRSDTGHGIYTPWHMKHEMLIGEVKIITLKEIQEKLKMDGKDAELGMKNSIGFIRVWL